jgi:aryl-alcohol dehydrogenase-like predicted oxidoreductase
MEIRKAGRSGLGTSVLGLGCNNFGMRIGPDESTAVVLAALDAGVTFFDTAQMYGGGKSAEFLGAALAGRRDEVVIATKFGRPDVGGSRSEIIRACEGSLQRLGTDYIDLYYQHYVDRTTPIEETLAALTQLVEQGKVRYLGSSNVSGWHVAEADHTARESGAERFTACQMEWSLLSRGVETEVVPACRRYELGMVAYFPLASGLLTGKYQRGQDAPAGTRLAELPYFAGVATEENWNKVERLSDFAEAHGRSLTELALGWVASQPETASVLVGATKPEQVTANVHAIEWRLNADERAEVADLAG